MFLNDTANTVPLWTDRSDQRGLASATKLDGKRMVYLTDGLPTTNRYLARHENAAFAVSLVRALARPGGRVVFVEAAFGNISEPTLLELMGPWALPAWWQILFLGVVVAYTLGKRFGLPEVERFGQRGTREMVDAVGDLFQRGRSTHVALLSVVRECDRQVRRALKLPANATSTERNKQTPTSLANAFAECEAAAPMRPRLHDALLLARKLEHEVAQFVGTGKRVARKRKSR